MYVGFCQIGSRIYFTNKDRLLKLVSIKKNSKKYFQKWYCSEIRKFEHFETLKLRQKFNFQLLTFYTWSKPLL